MATTASGTFTHCGTGNFFSLQYTCSGPNCASINDFPNTTCTNTGTILTCTNGVACSGVADYVSKFTFTQPETVVKQSYDITYGCQDVLLTNDGTTGGTNIKITDVPGCVSNTTALTNGTAPTNGTVPTNDTASAASSRLSPQTVYNNGSSSTGGLVSGGGFLPAATGAPGAPGATTALGAPGVAGAPGATTAPGAAGAAVAAGLALLPGDAGSGSTTRALEALVSSKPGALDGKSTPTIPGVAGSSLQPGNPGLTLPLAIGGGLGTVVTIINGVSTTICPTSQSLAPSAGVGNTLYISSALKAPMAGLASSVSNQQASTPIVLGATPVGGSGAILPSSLVSVTASKPAIVTSGAVPRYHSKLTTFFLLFFSFALLIQGTMALAESPPDVIPQIKSLAIIERPQGFSKPDLTALDLRAVDLTKIISSPFFENFAKDLAEYINGKVQNAEKGEELFAANLIAEVENAVCNHFLSSAITKFAFYDAIEVCIATIITGAALAPPAELVAIFGAGLLCNYLFSELVPGVDSVTNLLCGLIPKPCSADLLTDAKNCGKCGNVCPTGTCRNGACSSNTCTGQTCANFGPCGPGGTCVCASTAEGTGYCADGSTPCAGLNDCSDSANCPSGTICAVKSCCGRNVCVGATFCGGAGTPGVTPRYLLQRSYTNATLANMGVWVD